ncbi:MAG: dTDP-4-dehydrorhamnose reductase [Gammaproteobacteria bacterium]|nr:MAG: dTDP-4-dehydrorhamnose reductase [Gammaproteobacteria bacterium]
MKSLVLGATGQVGFELCRMQPVRTELVALSRDQLDICDGIAVAAALRRFKPTVVINAAAYTQVDRAESEPERAFDVNGMAPGHVASATRAIGARLIHLSTDFIFDGGQPRPWAPGDPGRPLNAYGRSKLAGEGAVQRESHGEAVIVRTAWLYSTHGTNFVKTMLRLMGARDVLDVVVDQVGSPTWARSLARALWMFAIRPDLRGTYHWTDAGVASWYDFAVAIQEEALSRNLLTRQIAIRAIRSAEYPTAAQRPPFSVLDTRSTAQDLGLQPEHWRRNLRLMLDEVAAT